MQIRDAVPDDLEQIKKIDAASFGENTYPVFVLRQFLDISAGLMKVAAIEDIVVGYAIGQHNSEKSESWFLSLGVLPAYRNRRIGEHLTEALLQVAQGKKAQKVLLTVDPENHAGIRIYQRLGFVPAYCEENYYLDNTPRIIMSKSLSYN